MALERLIEHLRQQRSTQAAQADQQHRGSNQRAGAWDSGRRGPSPDVPTDAAAMRLACPKLA